MKTLLNWLLLIALIAGPTAIAFHGEQAAATFLMTSLVIALASLNLPADRLEEFGIGPLKARLEKRIKEADELTDRLKEVMRLMLSVAVSAGMRTGRFAHQTQLYHQELFTNVEKIFERTGLDPSAKDEVLRDFYFFSKVDMSLALLGSSSTHPGSETEPLAKELRQSKVFDATSVKSMRKLASLYEVEALPHIQEWLNDFEALVLTNRIRRPEHWFNYQDDSKNRIGIIRAAAEAKTGGT
jgi:hypothetical protein